MKKLVSMILAAAVLLCAVCAFEAPAQAAEEAVNTYLSPIYKNSSNIKEGVSGWETKEIPSGCKQVTSSDTVWSGWYVVNQDVTINHSVTCQGAVYLILKNGTTLSVDESHNDSEKAGIVVTGGGNSLEIFAQSTEEGVMGKLYVYGGEDGAGIGGGQTQDGQNIIINGGNIEARGCGEAAGIGGGGDATITHGGNGHNITINGGYVFAQGGYYHGQSETFGSGGNIGAGIGGGDQGSGYDIAINGGTVKARGGVESAGIGGGDEGDGHEITINGGTVDAWGFDGGAGIGGGREGNGFNLFIYGGDVYALGRVSKKDGAAGIGGGDEGEGHDIIITDGTVEATAVSLGDDGGAGIGGGDEKGGYTIKIKGGTVTAKGACNGAGIGGGNEGAGKDITISGGTVTATGTNGGSGIGGGNKGNGQTITITGGTVTATHKSGNGGAGIGGGHAGAGNDITIQNATVYAYAGWEAAGIGGGRSGFYQNVRISNSYVYAEGSKIGAIGVGYGADGQYCTGGVYVDTDSSIYGDGTYKGMGMGSSTSVAGYTVVGIVEVKAKPAVTVTDSDGNTTEYASLQAAYEAAGTNTITLQKDVSVSQFTVAEDRTVTINLYGHKITGDGSGSTIINNGTLTLYGNGTITGGKAENGGNIYNAGTLDIAVCNITDGSATNGGNIYNAGTLTYSGNGTTGGGKATNGGNIYNAGTLDMTINTVTGGSAENGGGIYNAGSLTLRKVKVFSVYLSGHIIENSSTENGGGIYNTEGASFTCVECEFSGNTAGGEANNIAYYSETEMDMEDGTVENMRMLDPAATVTDSDGNTTEYASLQAAYEAAGTNTITLQKDVSVSQFTVAEGRTVKINLYGHKITGDGSGSTIINQGTLTIYGNGTITGGKAENGGNIYNAGTLDINMSTVTGGSATNGGNIYNGGTLNIGWIAIITDGEATNGGNIYNAGTLDITDNANVTGGSAENGGNIYNADTLTLNKCEIADGSATLGGGVYNAGSLTCGANAKIINNNATEGGGGVLNAEDAHCTYTDDNFSGNTAYGAESTVADVYGGAVFEATNYAREDGEDDVGSVFSGASLWLIIAGSVVILAGVAAVIVVKKRKNKKAVK